MFSFAYFGLDSASIDNISQFVFDNNKINITKNNLFMLDIRRRFKIAILVISKQIETFLAKQFLHFISSYHERFLHLN